MTGTESLQQADEQGAAPDRLQPCARSSLRPSAAGELSRCVAARGAPACDKIKGMSKVLETEVAYGGIVFDAERRVLLRKPSNGWGGYAWTFPKGAPDLEFDAIPEQTALREVREETGVTCEVVSIIPGRYESDTCFTQYFLMRPVSQVPEFDFETEEVRWVTVEEAVKLITLTTTLKGRKRDLDALAAAIEVLP